jgi:hypothetical protein
MVSSPLPHPQNHHSDTSTSQLADSLTDTGPVVRRPGAVKNKSKLRVSFNPGEDVESSTAGESDGPTHTQKVKLGASTALQDRLRETSIRENNVKPTYSKSYLDELRNSTPSTPAEQSVDEDEQRVLDIEAKFGPTASSSRLPSSGQTHIPSASEIAEKKARRARLALSGAADPPPSTGSNDQIRAQSDFVSLDDYDDDGEFKPQRMQVSTFLQPETSKDTRLEREDEDIAEGFEQFIEDDPGAAKGRYSTDALHIGRKAEKASKQKQREEMKAAIEHAELDSDEDSDASGSEDSDGGGRWAYESAQTHRGMDGLGGHGEVKVRERRPREPRETTGIVKLSVGIAGLRERVAGIEAEKERVRRRLEEVRRERVEVQERAAHVQGELDKLGKELEGLMGEEGANAGPSVVGNVEGTTQQGGVGVDTSGDAEMT